MSSACGRGRSVYYFFTSFTTSFWLNMKITQEIKARVFHSLFTTQVTGVSSHSQMKFTDNWHATACNLDTNWMIQTLSIMISTAWIQLHFNNQMPATHFKNIQRLKATSSNVSLHCFSNTLPPPSPSLCCIITTNNTVLDKNVFHEINMCNIFT